MEQLLSGLNEAQKIAVCHIDGPMMVIAGAGSGKTRVLTHRIAYMISKGIDPFHILALTFTNKASEEMRNRVMALLGDSTGRNVWMGTFHSIFSKILHIESSYVGFSPKFSVYDTDDTKSLIKSILKEMNLDDKIYRPTQVLAQISNAKSNLISDEEYCANSMIQREDSMKRVPALGEIYKHYNQRLRRADAMDFDDLLYYMYILLRDFPEMLYKYQHKFQYILIDEYQDTNYVQYLIIKKLAALSENICVVGDDAQSIYAFRGANIQNILNFKDDYPDYSLFKLEQNYRSTQNIIEAANEVITHNNKQIPKKIWTSNNVGSKIKVFETENDQDEAQAVVDEIIRQKESKHLQNSDFTILYRTNAQSRRFEEVFHRKGLPYHIYGGISFYKRKEIKDILAYFRLTINHKDDESLRRIINYPQRGIGLTSMEKVITAAAANNISLWECITNPGNYGLNLTPAIYNKFNDFVNKILSYESFLYQKNAFELGKYIADTSGISRELRELEEEPERYENLGELFNAMRSFTERIQDNPIDTETGEDLGEVFPSLDLFMNEVSLLTTGDENDEEGGDKIKLMTIHAAKGLEFPHVFVVGMEENVFPSYMVSSMVELEEERRLFYVAITRAQQNLTLSFAKMRFMFGSVNVNDSSRFIKEIPTRCMEFVKVASGNNSKRLENRFSNNYEERSYHRPAYNQQRETRPQPAKIRIQKTATVNKPQLAPQQTDNLNLGPVIEGTSQLSLGQKVFHDKFGIGIVNDIVEQGNDSKAVIQFDKFGTKTMLLRFAKLKPLLS